ncbi:Fe-S cluster assembly sulfur transfer protein SufU [Bifidobacterium criceti]|uniref:Nitrogen fixation protein NifU n=1 Tax=Bifidobacterium criceti TaxID=1960969 RepID=A0A2A2EER5_9BIFI|nr:SUF system NifU family Fe-S cluster assembly protein [Bifidobacterium criceti]PAU67467.1 nitrogen fixation protein NifU [Bifidobacterium criceti]
MGDTSNAELEQMYQEVILDASRHPHGKGTLPAADDDATMGESHVAAAHESCSTARSHQFNPTCGDEVTVHVEVGRDEPHRIDDIVWDGQGCSISQASLSIMVDLVQGLTVDEAMHLSDEFHALMQSRGVGLDDEAAMDELGDATVFQGVSKYPMRIKCALLGWEGLKDAVAKALAAQREPA